MLIGERGMSVRDILRPELPPIPGTDIILLAKGILGDAVMSKLNLIFSCFSGRMEPDEGLAVSRSMFK